MTRRLLFIALIATCLISLVIPQGFSRAQILSAWKDISGPTPTPTLQPTQPPVIIDVDATPPDRVLPPIGSNAGLVLGASVLVLIIIGGLVLGSRRKVKH